MVVSLKALHSTLGPKIIFPHFLSVKRVWHIYKKAIYYFPVSYFSFAAGLKLNFGQTAVADCDQKVKFTDFVKHATPPKMQLTEFRFQTNFKVH